MALSSAVLELFAFKSPIFGFCAFWGPNSRTDFGDGRIDLYQISGVIAQLSAQNQFVSAFRKIAPFLNGRRPIVTLTEKLAQNFPSFDRV